MPPRRPASSSLQRAYWLPGPSSGLLSDMHDLSIWAKGKCQESLCGSSRREEMTPNGAGQARGGGGDGSRIPFTLCGTPCSSSLAPGVDLQGSIPHFPFGINWASTGDRFSLLHGPVPSIPASSGFLPLASACNPFSSSW
ncbi:rCG39353, isoform CRA_a [Rattus norvegicus]|uniref:RCG39353, isoform CRA_a n=1 Tax=Rattus norvegicus TaxID=10116 RepID=A6I909_RAT|nr:rCG39353, isoform CRA_a [Rattus norvegicus]EDM17522.1 rCG39353, isoform CRA_a [Rattus norvegicus]